MSAVLDRVEKRYNMWVDQLNKAPNFKITRTPPRKYCVVSGCKQVLGMQNKSGLCECHKHRADNWARYHGTGSNAERMQQWVEIYG